MRLFLYEFITGGGLFSDVSCAATCTGLPPSLLAEGRAMISALAADALAMPDMEVRLLWDCRLAPRDLPEDCVQVVENSAAAQRAFAALAAWAEGTIVIAPESEGILLELTRKAIGAGGRLLSASPEVVALCSDKHRTAEHLQSAGVKVPLGMQIEAGAALPVDFPFPAVLKPLDGCGSQEVRLLMSPLESAAARGRNMRLEAFCAGQPASVAVLCGREQTGQGHQSKLLPLPACRQLLADDGSFAYLGGSLPLPAELAERAQSLALRAVASLPHPLGYIGVDLVLGPAADGSQDVVIEINPRLTTSYVGLRHATSDNLLAAWLQLARGGSPPLKFSTTPIQFRANGQVTK